MGQRRKSQADPAEEADSPLHVKYGELARKYADLVATLERRSAERVMSRFGWLGLQATGTAFALLRGERIVLANRRWKQLAAGEGPWQRRSPESDGSTSYPDLNALARAEARAVLSSEAGISIHVFDRTSSDTSLELRFEVATAGDDPSVMALATDVTERLRREQELLRTREALLQKEHLRILGEMTASVTHEIGSTLRGMAARITVLSSDPSTARRHHAVLRGLMESLQESQRALRRLLAAARSGSLVVAPVELSHIIEQAIAVLHLDASSENHVSVRVHLRTAPVLGTPAELSHVFITLLRNAREAMPDGGEISISGSNDDGYVKVLVADRGTGIPKHVLPRLFEPFFTTKGDKGTGLGLWLAASTMRRLGGSLTAANRRSGGAVFTLHFRPAPSLGVPSKAGPLEETPLRSRRAQRDHA
jgi:signal transduction histidine kinase